MRLSVIIVYACCMGLSTQMFKNTLYCFVDVLKKYARLFDGEVGVSCDMKCSTTNKVSTCVSM